MVGVGGTNLNYLVVQKNDNTNQYIFHKIVYNYLLGHDVVNLPYLDEFNDLYNDGEREYKKTAINGIIIVDRTRM
jgi:hypothetical protein